MHDVTIPALGMAMTEAILTRWYKQPGEAVATGDVLAEIETDKSAVDLESPAGGTLGPHLVGEGDTVPVGGVVVRILATGETGGGAGGDDAEAAATTAGAAAVPDPSAAGDGASAVQASTDGTAGTRVDEVAASTPGPGRRPHALSPRKRRLARLAAERGETGATGDPGVADAASETKVATAGASGNAGGAGGRLARDAGRVRRAISERVSQSWREIPHFAVQREIDATASEAALAALRADGIAATWTDLMLRALARAVCDTAGGNGDLGLAVATAAGVMVPVITGIPSLSTAELVAARGAAVARGRNGALNTADLTAQPAASLSNLGSRGVDAFTGVIATGQRLLLTAGRVRPRPVAIEGGIGVRPTLIATLNVDHRSFDGDLAADVLAAFDREFNALRTWIEGDRT
ncbi:MAG: 2-oxo acid dehydrogenase subunit E2 [Actinobacteria bacterium]|nr:2-oxo acid dehydrogenase subunit E2 [Actinomycetota bacterium]